jgi:glucose/arabinose dehydrogenase
MLREVASGLDDPTDLAVLADGRVLVAERAGRFRMLESGRLLDQPALALDDVRASPGTSGLLSLVPDPDFERTRFVYAVYTTDEGFRLSRFRESNNTLAGEIVLLDGIPAAPVPAAAVRFGPDSKLYVALDDGGEPTRAGDFGSYNGKILRLNADGSVPADQAGFTPMFAANLGATRGFDWELKTDRLWVAEGTANRSGFLAAIVDEGHKARRGRIVTRYALPDGAVPSSMLIYRHELIRRWRGDLLVALPDDRRLLRLRLDPSGSGRVVLTEEVLNGEAGRVRAIGVTREGVIYLANDTSLLTLAVGVYVAP